MRLTTTPPTKLCLMLGLLIAGCTSRAEQCAANANCGSDEGGAGGVGGGTAAGGASEASSSGRGGTNASAGGTSSVGGSSVTSTASYVPCNGACKDSAPVCKTDTNSCVQCVKSDDCKDSSKKVCSSSNVCVTCSENADCRYDATKPVCDSSVSGGACVECKASTDCKDASKPLCDTSTHACVSCLANTDCKDPSQSLCNTEKHECAPCKEDADCSQMDGKGVCDAGTCVQCTAAKEGACEGKSCHPKKHECTATERGSRNACEACEADSECIGGEIKEPTARCVPMTFGPTAEAHGAYCLQRRATAPCTQPFTVMMDAVSQSGAVSESYCGVNQTLTTCEAVRDLVGSRSCMTEDSTTECGNGMGGICKKALSTDDLRCTIPCSRSENCTADTTCPAPAKPWCQ